MNRLLPFFFLFILVSFSLNAQDVSLSSLNNNKGANSSWLLYQNNDEALYKIISNEALTQLQIRKELVEQNTSKEDWLAYQKKIKEVFRAPLEKFEKTPLNAKITGTIKRDSYTVEKILFESHPGFYVTSCLFIPKKRQKPAPTVIYVSGHSDLGFRSDVYQHVILNLVEKGFIVFAFDPIGQGERLQYLDKETGKSKIGGPTTEHSYVGAQTLLTGTSLSEYFIWDGVRAIDYLETRKEVDAKRIGITGRSGGGTQTALIAAYDDRIYAAAPECYITNFKRLLQSIGPQDAEQNPYNFIKNGLDHPDLIHMRAPKPTLIVTTTHDFFSQQGARETFAETQKSYSALGAPENLQFTEDFGKHESTKKNRETVYAFFQKSLNNPGNNTDVDVEIFRVADLWVTSTGQLGSSLKSKTIFDLNQEYFKKSNISRDKLKQKIEKTAGIEFNRKLTSAVFTGKIISENYSIQKYFLENNWQDFALPLYIVEGQHSTADKLLLWLNSEGKEKIINSELLQKFIAQGYTIISADLPGIGELNDKEFKGDGFVKNVPFNYTFGANLIGKSIAGIQTEALDLVIQFIQNQYPAAKTNVFSEGVVGNTVLFYSALKNPFNKIVFNETMQSWEDLVHTEYYDPKEAFGIPPGSLSFFDIRDLISFLPEGKVVQINTKNGKGKIVANQQTDSQIISPFKD